ncbi:MAG: DMT family transporter, partial [Pseudomonadota bacterium]
MFKADRTRGEDERRSTPSLDAGAAADTATPSDASDASDETGKAIAFLIAGLFLFSLQDIIIKQLSTAYSVHQIVFIRASISVPLLLVIIRLADDAPSLTTRRPWTHLLRGMLLFTAYTSFYLALAAMALADVVAIAFSSPLIITVFAVVFLGEKVGIKRWTAIAVGFIGVLFIVRPGAGVFEPAAVLAIVCAVTYGAAQLLARRVGKADGGAQMSLYATLVYVLLGGATFFLIGDGRFLTEDSHPSLQFLLRAWVWPTPLHMAMMVATAVISAIGMFFLSSAYQRGEASAVSPFEYTGLIWALAFGFLFFGEVP